MVSGGNGCSNWDNLVNLAGISVSGYALAAVTLGTGGLGLAVIGFALSAAAIASCNGFAPKI
jgi:hypothetical protein